jgi:hypothetical protein
MAADVFRPFWNDAFEDADLSAPSDLPVEPVAPL